MSTNVIKLIAGALTALFILILLGVLSYFAYHGKTMPDPIAYAIYGLITTATGILTALAGHAAGAAGASAQILAGGASYVSALAEPIAGTLAAAAAPIAPAPVPPVAPQ